jgi:hypothetical protein
MQAVLTRNKNRLQQNFLPLYGGCGIILPNLDAHVFMWLKVQGTFHGSKAGIEPQTHQDFSHSSLENLKFSREPPSR